MLLLEDMYDLKGNFVSVFKIELCIRKLMEVSFIILETISKIFFIISFSIQELQGFVKSSFIPSIYSFHRILNCTLNEMPSLTSFFNAVFSRSKWFKY